MADTPDSSGPGPRKEFLIRDQMGASAPEPDGGPGGGQRPAGPAVFAPGAARSAPAKPVVKTVAAEDRLKAIDFPKLLGGLRRRTPLIAGLALAALALGLAGGIKAGRVKYDARVSLLYRSDRQAQLMAGAGSAFVLKGLSRTTATSLFRRTSNMEQVITNLHLALAPDELRWRVETKSEKNSEIILLLVNECATEDQAVRLANGLAGVVVANNAAFYRDQAESAGAQFRRHGEAALAESEILGRQIAEFQSSNRLIEASADAKAFLDMVALVSARLSSARIDYQSLLIRIQNYKGMIAGLPDEVLRESLEDNPLKRRVSNTEVALMEARTKYGPDNPRVRQLEDEIREMRRLILDKTSDQTREQVFQPNPMKVQFEAELLKLEAERSVLQRAVEDIEAELAAVETRFAFLPRQQLELSVMQQKHLALVEMGRAMKKSEESAAIAARLDLADFEILEPARQAVGRRSPLRVALPALALFGGLAGGLLLAALLELADPYLRTRRQVAAAYEAPLAQEVPFDGRLPGPEAAAALFLPVCRQVKDRWQRWQAEGPCPVLGVAASGAGEGKSSVAYQVARYGASLGYRTALLDFDYRDNPWLPKELFRGGLEDYLRGGADWAAVRAETGGLTAMKVLAPTPDLLERMNSPAMARLWETLQERFDLVVVETPGVLDDHASVFLAGLAHRFIFVIGSGLVRKADADRALATLEEGHARPSLIVLNRVSPAYSDPSHA